MDSYEHFEINGNTVKIYREDDPEIGNPRDAFNVGVMLANGHRRYTLGDGKYQHGTPEYGAAEDAWKGYYEDSPSFQVAANRFRAWAIRELGATVVLPLWLLDHSGLAMRTGAFAEDPGNWDSGIVGWIFDTKRTREEAGTPEDRIEEVLQSEVKSYDMWLQGEVYGYTIEDPLGTTLDSCGGYLGVADATSDATEAAENIPRAVWYAVAIGQRGGVRALQGPYETQEDASEDGIAVLLEEPTKRYVTMIAPPQGDDPAPSSPWEPGKSYELLVTPTEERAKLAEGFTYPHTEV